MFRKSKKLELQNKNIKKISNNSVINEILDWLKPITLAFFIAYIVTNFLIINTVVPSESMEKTINTGDRVITNRLAYIYDIPKRGDIIVFPSPDDDTILVKRVIGLPGETINIVDGEIYVNDEILIEEYVSSKINDKTKNSEYTVPDNSVFVMGDNREFSFDSRYWHHKYVEIDNILGKVVFRYYPKLQLISWFNDKLIFLCV